MCESAFRCPDTGVPEAGGPPLAGNAGWHGGCSRPAEEDGMVQANLLHRLNYRLIWDKKLRIGVLAFITFAAMC